MDGVSHLDILSLLTGAGIATSLFLNDYHIPTKSRWQWKNLNCFYFLKELSKGIAFYDTKAAL
jgi:hypothetical protein